MLSRWLMHARPIKRAAKPRERIVKRRASYAQGAVWIALLRNFSRVVTFGLHLLQTLCEQKFRNVVFGCTKQRLAGQNPKISVKVGRDTHSDQNGFRLLWRTGHTRRL